MTTVSVQEADTQFLRLLADVEAGGEVVISRGDQPIAKIVGFPPVPKPQRVPGTLKGLISIGPEFFEPLPEDELRLREGGGD
jgi:antitoxin (DNA-binding transcriptional repressor) of toxin-antitoxin stability system